MARMGKKRARGGESRVLEQRANFQLGQVPTRTGGAGLSDRPHTGKAGEFGERMGGHGNDDAGDGDRGDRHRQEDL